MGVFHTNFSVTAPQFLNFLSSLAWLFSARFLFTEGVPVFLCDDDVAPPFQRASPPVFQGNHIPKEDLVIRSRYQVLRTGMIRTQNSCAIRLL